PSLSLRPCLPTSPLSPYTTLFRSLRHVHPDAAHEPGGLRLGPQAFHHRGDRVREVPAGRAAVIRQTTGHRHPTRIVRGQTERVRSEEHTSELVTRSSRMPSSA